MSALDLILPAPTEADTAALGERIARHVRAGDVIGLEAPLGFGKTVLIRALIRVLTGPATEVPSPTFTLIQQYDGDPPLLHADLYRLEDPEEALELGIEEALTDGVALIEWPGRGEGIVPAPGLLLTGEGEGASRRWRLTGDEDWARRWTTKGDR